MALLEMFGFDNADVLPTDSIADALRGLVIVSNVMPGRYSADGLVTIDFARAHVSSAFSGRIVLDQLAAPVDEIIMALDLRPRENLSGGPDGLWGGDFLEAGILLGPLPPPGVALTAADYDRRVIVRLNDVTGSLMFHRGRTDTNFDWIWWAPVPTVLLGITAPGTIVPGEAWAHYEFRFNLTTDTIECRKNGVQIFLAVGVGMGGGLFSAAGYTRNQLAVDVAPVMDSLYILSTVGGVRTTYIPDARVSSYLPTADAGPNAWTPLVPGPNFQMVDDVRLAPPPPQAGITDQDVTYVESVLAADRDMYLFTPTIPALAIFGVQFYAYFKAMGGVDATVNLVATSPEAITSVYGPFTIRAGYTDPGDLATTYMAVRSPVLELDPVTGLNWVDARLALWQFGFENVAGTQVRATQIYIAKILTAFAPPVPPPPVPLLQGGGGRAVQYKAGCSAPPNEWDLCMVERADTMMRVNQKAVCEAAPPPWREPPHNARRFQQTGTILLPAIEGADFQVLQWQVPTGYDGIITTITNLFTGAGYVNGSGDLIWRLMIDNQWIKDLDAIDVAVGRPSMPLKLKGAGYRVQSHQLLRYFVQLGPGALARLDPLGNIICGLFGWLYPRAGIGEGK